MMILTYIMKYVTLLFGSFDFHFLHLVIEVKEKFTAKHNNPHLGGLWHYSAFCILHFEF